MVNYDHVEWLTIAQAAEFSGYDEATIRRGIKRRHLRSRKQRVRRSDLVDWMYDQARREGRWVVPWMRPTRANTRVR